MNASDSPVEAYWEARRLELSGRPSDALKRYSQLVGKIPESAVAADRLLETAVAEGDLKSALRAVRIQQLGETADAESALIPFVDAWRRKDWRTTTSAITAVAQGKRFAFMAPLLKAWTNVAQGKASGVTSDVLRNDPLLAYYSIDQLIYLDIATGDLANAKQRLMRYADYAENHGRHTALVALPSFAKIGDAEMVKGLTQRLGLANGALERSVAPMSSEQIADWALSALFARLSDQLKSQSLSTEAFYFARLANWISPTSEVSRMTLAKRLDEIGDGKQADALMASIVGPSLHANWALHERVLSMHKRGSQSSALALVRAARGRAPGPASDLLLLEAQLLDDGGDRTAAIPLYREVQKAAVARKASGRERAYYSLLLAQALEQNDDWEAARKEVDMALSFDGENAQLLNFLGYGLLERRQDIKRGFELVNKAHRLEPNSAAITDSLGWGYLLNGDLQIAIPLLETAVEGAFGDVTINEHLGDAYWKAGRRIEARYAWRAALLSAKDSEAKRLANKIDLGLNDTNAAP